MSNPGPSSQFIPRKKSERNKFNPVEIRPGNVVHNSEIGECMVIMMGMGSEMTQFTIHRPIGFTTLNKETDWVITRSIDLPDILRRKDHPEEKRIDEMAKQAIYQSIATNITGVSITEGALFVYGVPRAEIVNLARSSESEAQKKEKATPKPAEPKSERKSGKAPKKPKALSAAEKEMKASAYISFIPIPEVRTKELEIRAFIKTNTERVREALYAKYPHETKGGTANDRPQVASGVLKGKTLQQVYDWYVTRIAIPIDTPPPSIDSKAVASAPTTVTATVGPPGAKKAPSAWGDFKFNLPKLPSSGYPPTGMGSSSSYGTAFSSQPPLSGGTGSATSSSSSSSSSLASSTTPTGPIAATHH